MADITFDYTPTTGAVLSADGVSRNLYQSTASRSLFETLNGRVTFQNLAAGGDPFKIQPHLVRPGQAGFARSEGRVFSADYFSDLWAGNNDGGYVPVAGACISFRVPYDVSFALCSASVFLTQWRQFGAPDVAAGNPFIERRDAPNIYIQTFFGNNEGIVYTRRELAQTCFLDPASSGTEPSANVNTGEIMTCHHYNLLHYRVAGGTGPNVQLQKGYGTFGLSVYIPQNTTGQDEAVAENPLIPLINGDANTSPAAYYSGIHRVRVYARNVTVAALL